MEFIDCKVPYPSLYMIKKDEADKIKGTALTVYQPAIGQFVPEYILSKEPHSSNVSLEVLKDVSVFSSVTPKHQKMCIFQPNALNRGLPSSFSHLIRSSASWRSSWYSSAPSLGEFSHVSGYWEISIELGYMMQFGLLCSLTTSTKASSAPSGTYGVHPPIRFTRQLRNYPFLLPNGTSKPEVQATKVKRNVVESSTSESDCHRDHHWKHSKKIQLADIENPRDQEASSKGKDVEAPNDSTHSSSSITKEIDDDSDRLPLTQVLASRKGKATSSKIPLHLPPFSKHGVQQADLTSSRSENVVITFEPPVLTSPSSISTFRCDEVVARSKRKMVEIMWDDLFQQLSTTSFDGLHFIKEEVNGILQAMSQHGGMMRGTLDSILENPSPIKSRHFRPFRNKDQARDAEIPIRPLFENLWPMITVGPTTGPGQ
ncbi:hypothetical protein ACJIZ3_019944 [Penstemon smallii]|uniref:Uncharacterized protein n=1 Tax=Penstemon smallii TaxID=265156 RepID=A0ABD3T475_9LAMI